MRSLINYLLNKALRYISFYVVVTKPLKKIWAQAVTKWSYSEEANRQGENMYKRLESEEIAEPCQKIMEAK